MSDYIKREDAILRAEYSYADLSFESDNDNFVEELKRIPPADVEPVRHGRWIPLAVENSDGIPSYPVKCSRKDCGCISWTATKYCYNCGAKMDEEE